MNPAPGSPVVFDAAVPFGFGIAQLALDIDLHFDLIQQALDIGLQAEDLHGLTPQQLMLYLSVPPAPPTPLAPLVDHDWTSPGEKRCETCLFRAAKCYCHTCSVGFLCYHCMDAGHGDHNIIRSLDMVARVDLTSDGIVSVDYVPKHGAVPLCGHRVSYPLPACSKCVPLMRLTKAQCPICFEEEEGMLSACPSCKKTIACQCCWKALVSDAVRHDKHLACPLCRTVVL